MNSRHAYLLLIVAEVFGCTTTKTATQVMVIVDAEPGVKKQTQKLHIVVSGGSDTAQDRKAYDRTFSAAAGKLEWPRLVALAPSHDDADRVYEVVATATDAGGDFVAQVRAISGYVAHRQLELRLLLEDSCISTMCGDRTCKAGKCTSANVDPGKLATYSPDHTAVKHPPQHKDAGADGASSPAPIDGSTADAVVADSGSVELPIPGLKRTDEICNGADDDSDGHTDEETQAYCEAKILNAETKCTSGRCVELRCHDGYADCDGRPQNGCEKPFCDCNACTDASTPIMTPDAGHDAGPPPPPACGSSTCQVGSECCDGVCVDTTSSCFPWPCVPGTARDKNNCGRCGMACGTFCCAG